MTSALGGRVRARLTAIYRADPAAIAPHLPDGLRPLAVRGAVPVALCYTRLEPGRAFLPQALGGVSDHLAWRVPVERDGPADSSAAIWVARRHTSSWIAAHFKSLVTRGAYTRAHFELGEDGDRVRLRVEADGHEVFALDAAPGSGLRGSMFATVREAEEALDRGVVIPPDPLSPGLDHLGLSEGAFCLEPLTSLAAHAPRLEGAGPFPAGSFELDSTFRLTAVRRVGQVEPRVSLEELEASAAAG